jgi:hypothetical protein
MSDIEVGRIVISDAEQFDRPEFKATVRVVTPNSNLRLLGYFSVTEAEACWETDLHALAKEQP